MARPHGSRNSRRHVAADDPARPLAAQAVAELDAAIDALAGVDKADGIRDGLRVARLRLVQLLESTPTPTPRCANGAPRPAAGPDSAFGQAAQ